MTHCSHPIALSFKFAKLGEAYLYRCSYACAQFAIIVLNQNVLRCNVVDSTFSSTAPHYGWHYLPEPGSQ